MFTLQYDPPRDKPLNLHCETTRHAGIPGSQLPPLMSENHRKARDAVLIDAYLEAQGQQRWISYSRNNNFYAARRRYLAPGVSRSTVVASVDSLATAGFLEHQKAEAGTATGRQSRFRATPEFLDTIKLQPPRIQLVPREIIRLKVNKQLADYRDTEQTKAQRRHLNAVNEAISATKLDIDVPDMVRDGNVIRFGEHAVYPTKTALYRIFNQDFAHGGRGYTRG